MPSTSLGWSQTRFVTLQGVRLAYRTAGPQEGSPVLLIHAFASQSRSWETTATTLAAKGYRVIAPDLRGHGRSPWTTTYALADFEQDLVALLDALGLHQVNLIGHSLGGHLALRLATRMPERIRCLVVEATPVPPRDEDDARALAAGHPGPAWRRSLRLLGAGRLLRLMLLREFDVRAARTVLRELKAPMPTWWKRLDTIASPTLLMAGQDDGAFSERLGLLAVRIPTASALRLGNGHHLHTMHLAAFLDAVIPFLQQASPATGDALLRAAVQ